MTVMDITAPGFVTTLTAPYTLSQYHTFLKTAYANAGFPTPVAENLGITNITVYEFNLNPSATYGRFYFVVESSISGTTITTRTRLHYYLNYNLATFAGTASTGANNTTGGTTTCLTTNSLIAYAIPTTMEMKGVVILENGVFEAFYGFCYFSNKESWYDENLYCWAMLINPTSINNYWLPYPNINGVTGSTAIACKSEITTFAGRNPVDNKVYVVTAPYITGHTWGIVGQLPDDIGVTNSLGLLTADIMVSNPGVEEYWLVRPIDNGLAIRCV
jgi:hypothetical protein